jgi:hypothetical protein
MAKAKTLKELKDNISVVKATQLELRMNATIINGYSGEIMNYVLSKITSTNGHIGMPTLHFFLDTFSDVRAKYEEMYISKMQGQKGYEQVDVDTMIAQGFLFDSLCFVFDSQKNTYSLATMNFELLYDLDIEYDMLKQVLTKNKQGFVKAYRIDVEYCNDDKEFTFKAVNPRDFDIDENKLDTQEGKRFFIVPYTYVMFYMKAVEALLKKGYTLRVHQSLSGIEKIRLITTNQEILSKYCDVPEATKGLTAKFFPLKGFFYAPSIGAPSTSAMVTNINLFNTDVIKNSLPNDFKTYNITKPSDAVGDMIAEGLIINKLMTLKAEDIGDFYYIIENLPVKKYFAADAENISDGDIVKYLHSLSDFSKKRVYSMLGIEKELARRRAIIGNGRQMTAKEINDIENTFKNGICRVIIQKKDCRLSAVMGTNNKVILQKIYGNPLKYESFAHRFYMLLNWLNAEDTDLSDDSINEELKYLGIGYGSEGIKAVNAYLSTNRNDIDEENLKGALADIIGVSLKRSNAQVSTNKVSSNVLVRTLTARLDENHNPVDYYKYIDKSKIIGGMIFE